MLSNIISIYNIICSKIRFTWQKNIKRQTQSNQTTAPFSQPSIHAAPLPKPQRLPGSAQLQGTIEPRDIGKLLHVA